MKNNILLYLLSIITVTAGAQTLSVSVPSRVSVGENFRLSYTISSHNVRDFQIGKIPRQLELIIGPNVSSQSSIQMVNGHASSSSSVTYTYILCATKNGSYVIPSAHVNVNGKTVASNAVRINVSGTAPKTNGAPRMHDDSRGDLRVDNSGTEIKGSDLFMKVTANKRRVHEQEPVLLTYKVYTLVELTQLEGKMPDLTGFHTQEVELPRQKSYSVERVNGRPYRCVTWSQYVMYPQMTGKLEIPSIIFKGTVIQQNRNIDPYEAFFNGGSGYTEVKRAIRAPGLSVQVDPLPSRPDGFSGGVGKFNISAQINKEDIKSGEPVNIRVVIGGNGNLKLIKQPKISFPKDFDTYDAKVTDKTKLTGNGVEGHMIYDFVAVPRNPGEYVIPPISFIYYDTGTNSYKTAYTQSFKLTVTRGFGTGNGSVADYTSDLNNKDIRPIKQGYAKIHGNDVVFYGTSTYWTVLGCLLLGFVALLVVFRKRALDNADVVRLRGKKANKIAMKRLRTAHRLMISGNDADFYDEVLRALWGYIGDKLNIPVEKLSRDNISEKLAEKYVDDDTTGKFIAALDECEYERYAPGDAVGNMGKTYETAKTAIVNIENVMKSSFKKPKWFAVVFLVLMLGPRAGYGVEKKNTDIEYSKGNYQRAIKDYEALLQKGPSSDIYYNLGNAYYRTDNITRAVLNYERALLYSPGDKDIAFNLQMARSKTIDKITPKSEMFFVTWYRALVNIITADAWAVVAVVGITVALLLVLIYLFSSSTLYRKIGFFSSLSCFVLFVLANVFACQQKQLLTKRNGAIVMSQSAVIKSTPSKGGKDLFIIHEGTRVDVTDATMKDWKNVRLADGREGWILTSQIEMI